MPPALRIAYLVQQFPPEVGAGPARVTEMAQRWRECGAEVTVVTAMPGRAIPGRAFGEGHPGYEGRAFAEEDWNGIRVLRSWAFRATKPGFVRTISNNASFMASSFAHAVARLGPVDVLIASSPPFFPHIAGAAIAAIRGMPLVIEIRDLWPDYVVDMGLLSPRGIPARALFALERALIKRAAHVTVVTESFRERVIGKGARPESVDVLPNGVDTQRYRADPLIDPSVATLKRDGEFLVGYLGTFGASQSLKDVIDAAAIVAERAPDVRFVLAGDGLDRARVVAHAAQAGVTNLEILPPIPKEQTRSFYNVCDACLVPLAPLRVFEETIPSKIFEILACERPVLASLAGEGRRVVETSGGGLAVQPGDANAIANGVLQLKAIPPHQRADMGARGRAFVAAHYDRIAIADRYLALLHRVAAAHHAGGRSR